MWLAGKLTSCFFPEDRLLESALDFAEACEEFQQTLIGLHSSPSIAHQLNLVRLVNDKLMNIERAFILPQGLPGRPYIKYVQGLCIATRSERVDIIPL